MALPASLTGGQIDAKHFSHAATGSACAFLGSQVEEPFRNGYQMTQFMVGTAATWTCITDTIIHIVALIPHDGRIHAAETNVKGSPGYQTDEPTHYRISEQDNGTIVVNLYYDYATETPPTSATTPDFYIAWKDTGNGNLQGKLVIEADRIGERDIDDPSRMRMDFQYTPAQQTVNMYLQYDENPWANGFRIEIVKDLTAPANNKIYTAKGIMDMNRQFLANLVSDELPDLRMHTVADQFGKGAASAQLNNVALPIHFNDSYGLGEYILDTQDLYFFRADKDWDWISKSVVRSEYRGQRNLLQSGGTSEPLNPSQDQIVSFLNLDQDYFTNGKCELIGDDCNTMLNAIFTHGFSNEEKNHGQNPNDWRSSAVIPAAYLTSVYPSGFSSWNGVFTQTFSTSN